MKSEERLIFQMSDKKNAKTKKLRDGASESGPTLKYLELINQPNSETNVRKTKSRKKAKESKNKH